jgi:hypothetical protein
VSDSIGRMYEEKEQGIISYEKRAQGRFSLSISNARFSLNYIINTRCKAKQPNICGNDREKGAVVAGGFHNEIKDPRASALNWRAKVVFCTVV